MRSGNPVLKDDTFLDLGSGTVVRGDAGTMTLNGTVNKTAFLLVLTLAGALFSWSQFSAAMAAGNPGAIMPYVWGGAMADSSSPSSRSSRRPGRPTPPRSTRRWKACSSVRCRRCSNCASPAS